jgi:tRNA nucleotidyltransferase (CCA-adding enzyme)
MTSRNSAAIKYYQVGGFVRDKLLGLQPKDLDYAVEAPSYQDMVAWIRDKQKGAIYLEKPEYLTVRAHLPGKPPADFVLCRKDGVYTDGRRPDSVEPGTIYDDLARRDFTVNAIAYDEESDEHFDPFNGIKDLKEKTLRCVGSAQERFAEDALRMLRAIRFAITKNFQIDFEISRSLTDQNLCRLLSDNVSEERKREELLKCFAASTLRTLSFLEWFPLIKEAVLKNVWLMPTLKEKK